MKTTVRFVIITILCLVLVGGLWIAAPPTSEARGATWTATVFATFDPNPATGGPTGSPLGPATAISAIAFDWTGAPVIGGHNYSTDGVPADYFAVRFVGSMFFTAGNYRFTVQVDDGMRLRVDGVEIISQWVGGSKRTFQADYSFSTDGNHSILVEMFDNTFDAAIYTSWALIGPPTGGGGGTGTGTSWFGEFFSNTEWSGSPTFTASFPPSGLNQNWGAGSPGGAVPADYFTARFTRTINVPGDMPLGMYLFYAAADDAFRFTIDVSVIMDHTTDFVPGQLYTAEVAMLTGPHILKFEYRELTANAALFLTWYPPNAQNPALPPPAGAPIPAAGTPIATPMTTPGAGAPPPAPVGVRGKVMGNLRIRERPTIFSPKIGLMPWGTEVDLIGKDGGLSWYMVNYNGTVGWSFAPWIRIIQGTFAQLPYTDGTQPPFEPPPATEGVVVQAYGNMRIRSGPGFQFPRIARAIWGSRVQLLARSTNGLWYKIRYGDIIGWSFATWYRTVQGDPSTLPVSDQ